MKYKIGIIGYGHVGKAMHQIFKDWEVSIYDPYVGYQQEDLVNKSDLAIICVPTPERKDGSCDISIVESSIDWCESPVLLIKSAVIPGTTDYLKKKYKKRIVVSPEYTGESKYYLPEKWKNPLAWGFQIFGGDEKDTAYCVKIFKPLLCPTTFFYQVDAKTAEMIKYAENVWGAMKVTWANEIYEICQVLEINWDKVREGWALDSRVEKMHTAVYEDNRGFGGKCYPKDLKAIIKASEDKGYEPKLLKEVWDSNLKFRAKNIQNP